MTLKIYESKPSERLQNWSHPTSNEHRIRARRRANKHNLSILSPDDELFVMRGADTEADTDLYQELSVALRVKRARAERRALSYEYIAVAISATIGAGVGFVVYEVLRLTLVAIR